MCPDRLEGKPYQSDTDLWSLGVVLWECVTGGHPFITDPDPSFFTIYDAAVKTDTPRL